MDSILRFGISIINGDKKGVGKNFFSEDDVFRILMKNFPPQILRHELLIPLSELNFNKRGKRLLGLPDDMVDSEFAPLFFYGYNNCDPVVVITGEPKADVLNRFRYYYAGITDIGKRDLSYSYLFKDIIQDGELLIIDRNSCEISKFVFIDFLL